MVLASMPYDKTEKDVGDVPIGRGDRHLGINKHNPGTHDYRLENIVFLFESQVFLSEIWWYQKKAVSLQRERNLLG